MSVKSKIGWTDRTWNPVSGCTKISPACDNCYAERMSKRMTGRFGYPEDEPFKVTLHPDKLPHPLSWRKPSRIFVVSMGDLFHDDVPDEYVASVFGVMALCPQHTFQILTKRPRRMKRWMDWAKYAPHDLAPIRDTWPLHNVWLGVTAEDQQRADERIPVLLQVPAAVRFVSVEPMLEPVDIRRWTYCESCGYTRRDQEIYWDHHLCTAGKFRLIDWVICGGENGPGARPMHTDWVLSLRDQCVESDTPFFLKDGQELDGRIWEQFPEKRGS